MRFREWLLLEFVATGTTISGRAGKDILFPGKGKVAKAWQELADEVLALRKYALSNPRTSKSYMDLLEKMHMAKISPQEIRKRLEKIRSQLYH